MNKIPKYLFLNFIEYLFKTYFIINDDNNPKFCKLKRKLNIPIINLYCLLNDK